MEDHLVTVLNFLVPVGLLAIGMHAIRQLVPGPYRFVKRLLLALWRPISRGLLLSQIKRRGIFYALSVHTLGILALTTLVVGIITGICTSIVAGIVLIATAFAAKRFLDTFRRLRSRRTRLPGWRRL